MTVDFTVRTVEPDKITVDFADGSWAQVPIKANQSRAQIEAVIASFNAPAHGFSSVEDVPFTEGEVVQAKTTEEVNAAAKAVSDAQLMGYRELRANEYPALGDQLDALYWARKGDTAALDDIDTAIAAVKEAYPKDMAPITRGEYDAAVAEASA